MKSLSCHIAVLQTMIDLQKGQLLSPQKQEHLIQTYFSPIPFVKGREGPSCTLGCLLACFYYSCRSKHRFHSKGLEDASIALQKVSSALWPQHSHQAEM